MPGSHSGYCKGLELPVLRDAQVQFLVRAWFYELLSKEKFIIEIFINPMLIIKLWGLLKNLRN